MKYEDIDIGKVKIMHDFLPKPDDIVLIEEEDMREHEGAQDEFDPVSKEAKTYEK